ncbi:Acetylcholine receptor subunit alpha-like [Portunus trituberculatus]|uniref:Acetylcholine receptor subunit alpha-like n=1 Tax=Portunus trituberculatus TaxID=210409 RepID=A0A5B7ETN5_PORTR|nr:Acetylcholine receptor subunit alpha-like [Portunus trituberculatus]
MAPWVRRVFIHILPRLLIMKRPQYQLKHSYDSGLGSAFGGIMVVLVGLDEDVGDWQGVWLLLAVVGWILKGVVCVRLVQGVHGLIEARCRTGRRGFQCSDACHVPDENCSVVAPLLHSEAPHRRGARKHFNRKEGKYQSVQSAATGSQE